MDSDDTLPIDTISNYIRIQDFTLYDIIIGLTENRNYSFDEIAIENYRHCCIRGEVFTPALWGKLFKKELFNEYIFDFPSEIIYGEDMISNIRLSFNAQSSIRVIKKNVYNYRNNEEGVMHSFKKNVKYEILFYKYLKQSIPTNKISEYAIDIIHSQLVGLNYIIGFRHQISNIESNYIKYLKSEVDNNHYNLSFKQRILLCPNSFFRFIGYLIIKIRNKIFI